MFIGGDILPANGSFREQPIWIPATSSFVPTDIAGLYWYQTADYNASTGTCADSGNRTHADLTQATSGLRATKQTSVINGLPVRRYDGVDDVLNASVSIGATMTFFTVAAIRASGPPYSGITAVWGSAPWSIYLTNQFATTLATHATGDDGVVNFNTWVNGVNVNASLDGDYPSSGFAVLTISYASFSSVTAASEGKLNASFWGKLDIAEVLIYNTVLSTGDRQSVELYLKNKYAL